jgi:LPXTG-site transpeptidase (sortase) family protein
LAVGLVALVGSITACATEPLDSTATPPGTTGPPGAASISQFLAAPGGPATGEPQAPSPRREPTTTGTGAARRPTATITSSGTGATRSATGSAAPTAAAPARTGTPAASTRVRFVPTSVELPGHGSAPVVAERTVDGTLQIPEDISSIGWWDGSAFAGDPFGATVLAGHIDSRAKGFGFFATLLTLGRGDRITVSDGTRTLTYRVTMTQLIRKVALAADGRALSQHGDHRLVLITCSGRWNQEQRSYDSNLVVIAKPVPVG